MKYHNFYLIDIELGNILIISHYHTELFYYIIITKIMTFLVRIENVI